MKLCNLRNVVSLLLMGSIAIGCLLWWKSREELSIKKSSPPKIVMNEPLSPVVQQIVSEGPTMPYLKFNYVIKELSINLSQPDIDALLRFITQPKPTSFSEGEWGSLTNDIQQALTLQDKPNVKVAKVLIATYRDQSRSQLMRDYALQHIGGYGMFLINTERTRNTTESDLFDSLVSELILAASDSRKSWCGTSLNLLDGLLRTAEDCNVDLKQVSPSSLCELAIPVVTDSKAPLNSRLPALQLLSRRKSPYCIETARTILSSEDSKMMLVQSACAAVGQMGDLSDVELLQKTRENGDVHIIPAAIAAIRKLQQRFPN